MDILQLEQTTIDVVCFVHVFGVRIFVIEILQVCIIYNWKLMSSVSSMSLVFEFLSLKSYRYVSPTIGR